MTFTVAHEFLKEENSSRKATAHCEYAPYRLARTENSKAQKDFVFDNGADNETELLLEMLADADSLERPTRRHKSDRLDGTLVDTIGSMDHDGARF
jgi:hypothetical protein